MKIRKLTKTEVKVSIGVGTGLLIGICYKLMSSNVPRNDDEADAIINFIQEMIDAKKD